MDMGEAAEAFRKAADDADLLPRIYIDFRQPIEDVDKAAEPVHLTLGPYHNVRIASGAIYACHPGSADAGDMPDEFELASNDSDYWRLHDGAEDVRYWINIHTVRPENRPK